MAQESDSSKTADKGKGKAVDTERKADEVQKDKDGKPIVNGKKEDDKDDCMLDPNSCWSRICLTD